MMRSENWRDRYRRGAKFFGRVALGALGIALITGVCFPKNRLIIPSLLYFLVIVPESLWGGFASAAIVSLIATLCLDYFFVPPVLTWQINAAGDGAALLAYLGTSIVITRLASKARNEARTAERRRKDMGLLYQAASRLLSLGPELVEGPEPLRIFREVFDLRAVCVFEAASAKLQLAGESAQGIAEKTRAACIQGEDQLNLAGDVNIRCLHRGPAVVGAVGFEGRLEDESVVLGLSLLAATALERARAFRSASRVAADAQAEMLRSAILDAIAHEFKTPLAIILAAAGGLRETSPESEQTEMTEIIENQTLRLSRLTTRLLRIARLDRDNVTPGMEPTDLRALLSTLAGQSRNDFGLSIVARLGREPVEIMADPELLGLAINQLLDNAHKYSIPGSIVTVGLSVRDEYATVRVTSDGFPVKPEERERIFERFYRGAESAQLTSGAGLGLYVARKIVRAHGGSLDLERTGPAARTTTFRIALPVIEDDRRHERENYQSVSGG